ncbi:MAG: hypothetical protein WCY21_06520 [Candidatus Cloacimonadaceae bacterium]|nr:hypothetical protein [Candidatus Cloacimonadota bacterium]MDX9949820.1 hypothetical protein [Candidatus Syntrophosphaera sp.]NLN84930.1 hypothetical protein [Candidatus Cloacimonadota bacterium]
MKKLTIIALLAMMLIGMLAFTGCKAEEVEETEEQVEEVVEEVEEQAEEVLEEGEVKTEEEAPSPK